MKKNRIRLSESQLHKVIKESVKNVLKEETTVDDILAYLNGESDQRIVNRSEKYHARATKYYNDLCTALKKIMQLGDEGLADIAEDIYNSQGVKFLGKTINDIQDAANRATITQGRYPH